MQQRPIESQGVSGRLANLRVAAVQLARLAADGDEASAKLLWRYVEREVR